MSAERRLLLSDEDQLNLAVELQTSGIMGIFEDPDETMTLKSGRLSPHYMDVRKGLSNYTVRRAIAYNLYRLADLRARDKLGTIDKVYDHFSGTPEAMTSYAASIADIGRMSLLQPRVATDKKSGNKTPMLGKFQAGDLVAAFDDVVTDGQSKIDGIGIFTAAGLEVEDYFVLLDREEGGAPHVLEVTGKEVIPALGVSSMARLLKAERNISAQQFGNIARYLEVYGEPHAQETISLAI